MFGVLTEQVIGAAIAVHRELGPGLLESAYRECLYCELLESGLEVERERKLFVVYRGRRICGYRADLIVSRSVLVEVKSVSKIAPVHSAQILTYLKLAKVTLGLMINFNVPLLRQGIRRFVLDHPEELDPLRALRG